jgi:hypothetical protein
MASTITLGMWILAISLHQSHVLVNVKCRGCGDVPSTAAAHTSQTAEPLIFIGTAIDDVLGRGIFEACVETIGPEYRTF